MPKEQQKPLLVSQIQEALKNRQNVELRGKSIAVKKLLDELITYSYGRAVVPAAHVEDYTIFVLSNIAFPPSDKMTPENVMKQVLQTFGWPLTTHGSYAQF